MKNFPTRWQQRYERAGRRQTIFLLLISTVVILLLLVFGLPALFRLAAFVSISTRETTKTADTSLVPTIPRLEETYSATSSSPLTITGVADAAATVELFQNDQLLTATIAKSDGTFTWEATLKEGENIFYARAVGETGQRSASSGAYFVHYLANKPMLKITAPANGATLKNSPVEITGLTDPGGGVMINERLTVVNKDGSFSYFLYPSNGENKIKITAADRAGNQESKEIIVQFNP